MPLELDASATVRKFRTVRQEGRRQVERQLEYYNLEAIIAVGYRVNSSRATQFRRWATGVLRDFALRGYVPAAAHGDACEDGKGGWQDDDILSNGG